MFIINIFKKLIPHIMKVGGSLYLLQNGMDDSPMCGNEFPVKYHHTFGCFEAKFIFQVAIKSADLWLGEKYSLM